MRGGVACEAMPPNVPVRKFAAAGPVEVVGQVERLDTQLQCLSGGDGQEPRYASSMPLTRSRNAVAHVMAKPSVFAP
jgi:hypothetical protein